MFFFDAHSDIGVLVHLANKGLVKRELVDTYFDQMRRGPVRFSIVQLGGDFDHFDVDLRRSESVLAVLESMQREMAENQFLLHVQSKAELDRVAGSDDSGVIFSIEGCAAIDPEFVILDRLCSQGLRMFALTHNGANIYASGCEVKDDAGLTEHGRKLLDHASELGMILDLVHIGEKSFWEAIEYTSTPVYISHSNSKSLYDHFRNITDEQITAIAEKNGIIALNLLSEFTCDLGDPASLDRWLDHVDHMVDLVSVKHVGLGPDFFRYMMPELDYVGNIDDPSLLGGVPAALSSRGYRDDEVSRICGENLFDFMSRWLG